MDFILYVTTGGGPVRLQAPDGCRAVRAAIDREDAAGRPGARVVTFSYVHPGLGQFIPVGDSLLGSIPGTTTYDGSD